MEKTQDKSSFFEKNEALWDLRNSREFWPLFHVYESSGKEVAEMINKIMEEMADVSK